MEVNIDDDGNEDEELFGIVDVDAFIKIAIEKTFDDICKAISDKVNMDLAEEVVKEFEDKEAIAAKSQTYRRRKKASKSKPKRKLVVSDDEEEVDNELANPKDDISVGVSGDHDKINESAAATPRALLTHLEFHETRDRKAKAGIFILLRDLTNSMDTLVHRVGNSLAVIGLNVKSFSDFILKKLNGFLAENQNYNKIIEHWIQLSEDH
ncbi:hypothetical protein Dimus_024924 [Dionaea muscipula]